MSDDRDDEEAGRDRAKEIELRRAARRQRAIERLGTNNPKCVRCGKSDSLVLELRGGTAPALALQAASSDTFTYTTQTIPDVL